MERWHVPFHVIEREWTLAQFLYLLRGLRLNEAARKEAMEAMREESGARHGGREWETGSGGAARVVSLAEAGRVLSGDACEGTEGT